MVCKAGRLFPEDTVPEVLADPNPYVSRGGLKLEHALKIFALSPLGKTALDVGASTGGFTDCLLRQGAAKVFAIDVGYGQLDWRLRSDPRVIILERQNIRYLEPSATGCPADLAVIDVSFISLRLVIPPVTRLLRPSGDLVALVKPQFEVGKNEVESKGIIKTPAKHVRVLLELRDFLATCGWNLLQLTPSPITGQKGNREFLIHCRAGAAAPGLDDESIRQLALLPAAGAGGGHV